MGGTLGNLDWTLPAGIAVASAIEAWIKPLIGFGVTMVTRGLI